MLSKFITIFFLFFSLISFSQSNPIGFLNDGSFKILTARALGLGGAYTSIADDASALHWNPASLAFLKGPSVVLSGGLQKNFGGLNETEKENFTNASGIYTTASYSESPFKFEFNQIAVAIPIVLDEYEGIRITPSIGYSFSSNFTTLKETWTQSNLDYYDAHEDFIITYDIQGGRKDLSFGLGFSFNDNLSFGMTHHVYSGERRSTISETVTFDNGAPGSTATTTYSGTYISKHSYDGNRSSFGIKYNSYGEIDPEDDDYEEGVDVGLVIDLPSTIKVSTIDNGVSYTRYFNSSARYNLGFSVRSSSTLFCMDAIYEPTKMNTITKVETQVLPTGPAKVLTRIPSDTTNILSIGAGIESMKILRFGVRAKQYQYQMIIDSTSTATKQPWTFQLNGGFTFSDMNHRFNVDIGGSLEFYNWHTVLDNYYATVDYKGMLFKLLVSFRMNIPYN